MKVLLISLGGTPTTFGNCEGSTSKYGNPCLEYLAGFLRQNSDDKINTLFLNKPLIEDGYLEAIDLSHELFGVFVDISYFYKALEIFKFIKENTQAITFAFGRVATNCTGTLFSKSQYIDYALLGDPEESCKYLLSCLKNNSRVCIDSIATPYDYMQKSPAVYNNVNRWPCFDYYEGRYAAQNKTKIHCLSIKCDTCSGKCSFCWSRKQAPIFKDCDRIFEEIEYVSRMYDVRSFYFIDNNLFDFSRQGSKELLKNLFLKIKNLNRNLLFTALANVDSIKGEDKDLYQLMKEIGFYSLFLGVDTGNNDDLTLYRKRSTLAENIMAVNILKDVGIWVRFGFIFFNPYSTKQTIKQNYEFLCKIKSANLYHYGALKIIVFTKTPMEELLRSDGLLGEGYCGIDIYNYRFKDDLCSEFSNFISRVLIPRIENSVPVQYLKLKKEFEMVKAIDKCLITSVEKDIEIIERQEFEIIARYFEHLYIDYDLDYCKKNMNVFIQELQANARKNSEYTECFERVLNDTKIER